MLFDGCTNGSMHGDLLRKEKWWNYRAADPVITFEKELFIIGVSISQGRCEALLRRGAVGLLRLTIFLILRVFFS